MQIYSRLVYLLSMIRRISILTMVAALGFSAGCEKALFPRNLPRTPYERYQQLHGRSRVATEENAYGGQQPALRDRLRPLAQ